VFLDKGVLGRERDFVLATGAVVADGGVLEEERVQRRDLEGPGL
jgi:hypothetical protein